MIRSQKTGCHRLVLACVATVGLAAQAAGAALLHVPAQLLSQSLKDVARQTGANILFTPDAVRGLRASPVEGPMSAREAVDRLLSGTDLEAVPDGNGGMIVRPRLAAGSPLEATQAAAPQEMRDKETIIVTGIRGSLQRDLDIKRGALGLVDAVTMEDIGKFPDSNLATAMMRIPGVTVNRAVTSLAGIDSTTGDPSEITVRGFGPTFNETLFEGRKISSGVSDRAFDFSALTSDLVQQIEVLKTPNSALSAGAIGATINIRYPKPLDVPGVRLTASASATIAPEEGRFTPNGNFLFSDSFAGGRLGILVSGAYAETKSRSNEATIWGWEGTYLDPCQFSGGPACAATLTPDTARPVWFIQDYGIYQIHNWQMREQLRAVVQWQPDDAVLVTLNANFSRNDLKEFQYAYAIWNNATEMRSVVTNSNGTVTDFVRRNTPTDFDAAANEQVLQSHDVGLNAKWNVNGRLTLTADADLALSSLNPGGQFGDYSADIGYGPSTASGTNGTDMGMIVSGSGGHVLPYYTSYGPGGDTARFLDPGIIGSHVMVIMSQRNRNSVGQARLEAAWSGDDLEVTAGFHWIANHMRLTSYHDFENNQWQAYAGYGPDSNNFYTSGPDAGLPAGVHLPASMFTRSFSTHDFIPGWTGAGRLPPSILVYDPQQFVTYLQNLGDPTSPTAIPGFNWGCCDPAYHGRFEVVSDPAAYQHVFEDTYAAYVAVTRDAEIAGMPLTVHAGLRSEYTDLMSEGLERRPLTLTVAPSDRTAFLVTYSEAHEVVNRHGYYALLPNLDIKLQPTDDLQLRFDASRTLTRPPLNWITPVLNLSPSERVGSLVADGGNPRLRPYTSNNLDLAAEWYYAPNSYLSVDTFLKNVTNFIISDTSTQTINGVVDPTTGLPGLFRVSSFVNGPAANVYGVELAWQHVFDDSGFGFQVNSTIVQTNKPYDPHDISTSNFAVAGLADSANLVAFYDKNGFEMRFAVNWRDSYLDRFGQFQPDSAFGSEPVFVNPSWSLDLSTRYDLTERLDWYLEITNLLDATFSTRGRYPEQVLDVVAYGRRLTTGLHYEL